MKLIFAVLDVSLTMGLTRSYKTGFFVHLYLAKNDITSLIRSRLRAFH